jgi:hypothetical protein
VPEFFYTQERDILSSDEALAESDGELMRLLGKWTGKRSQSKFMVDPTEAGKAGKALEQWKSNRSLGNLGLKRLDSCSLKSNL